MVASFQWCHSAGIHCLGGVYACYRSDVACFACLVCSRTVERLVLSSKCLIPDHHHDNCVWRLILDVTIAFLLAYLDVIGEVKKNDFESSLLQATGAILLGLGIHILLTLVLPLLNNAPSVISVAHAMGYSLLPRIGIILWSFIKGDRGGGYQLEGSMFLKANFAVMSWTAF